MPEVVVVPQGVQNGVPLAASHATAQVRPVVDADQCSVYKPRCVQIRPADVEADVTGGNKDAADNHPLQFLP